MAAHGNLTLEEKKEIRKKRRQLRRDLIKKGIRSKKEFEIIAQQRGLVYGDSKGLLGFLGSLADGIGLGGVLALIAALVLVLGLVFAYAVFAKDKHDFTISLNGNLLRVGFDLSETEDFADPKVRLTSIIPDGVIPISIADIPEDLDNYEGSHNGQYYMAYTFWIRNHGQKELSYEWQMVLQDTTQGLEEAVWVMIFDEGKNVIYAKAPSGYSKEKLVGYEKYFQYDTAAHPQEQYFEGSKGKGIAATPFKDERLVAQGIVTNFKPEDKHKYTIVMWHEGDDPECTNYNLGGQIRYNFKFAVYDDEQGTFDDFIYEDEDYIKEQGEEEKDSNGIVDKLKK